MMRYVRAGLAVAAMVTLVATSSGQQRSYTMKTVGKHADEVLSVFVNSANSMAATSSLDESVKLWSLPDGKELRTLTGHTAQVNSASFSGDDKYLASGSNDGTVRVWDVESGKQLQVLRGHTAEVISVYFNPAENSKELVASTSFDKTVKLWDAGLGVELKTLRGHSMQTNAVWAFYCFGLRRQNNYDLEHRFSKKRSADDPARPLLASVIRTL
jgi:WD40 repeat protein